MGAVQDYLRVVAAWAERREIAAEAASFQVVIRGRKPHMPLPTFLTTAQPDAAWLASAQRHGNCVVVRRDDPILGKLAQAVMKGDVHRNGNGS